MAISIKIKLGLTNLNKIIITVGLLITTSLNSSAQEFSSIEKKLDNTYRIELIFKEISSRKDCDQIISVLKSIESVVDVEIFYPDTNHGLLTISSNINANTVIEKLRLINIELDPKSLRQ